MGLGQKAIISYIKQPINHTSRIIFKESDPA